ncbi:molybdopterin molybdotransferase MoeA [Aquifex aeolicus]|uniref:Molybdopterin molybdenumtransferase n=1 Tax=Aquifex aeolicus (strain VF5) TaxID=224324 RepID=O66448_AQUAE|nr:gephyrin-like molybdotransferase Glp [Aquifex aeolicus]AAC06407.1 molybdenum cofactor biosynthesis protein A [Aquifex aeolicus VF5]
MKNLTPLEEALKIVLENVKPLESERVFIHEALGRVLAEDVVSDTDKPLFDNSAMDGYAVRWEDIKEVPAKLKVIGEYAAGTGENLKVEKGTAVKIFTGAPIPEGADTVVPVEYTETQDGYVIVKKSFKQGANVRRRGEDVKKGEVVIPKGKEIRPYEMGMLASVNRAVVSVYRKPHVGILSTGDEILDVCEEQTKPSQIRTSNNYTVYGQVLQAGGIPHNLGIAPDEPQKLKEIMRSIHKYDIFITTGGVSMGEKDYVQYLVEDLGIDVKFHKLRIKPAKPVLFGVYGENKLFFGLPGNPVSAAVAFDLLVYPAIKAMQGHREVFKQKVTAILEGDYRRKNADRREFARCRVWFENGRYHCEPYPKQDSHMLTSLVNSNAYMVVYEGVNELKKGQEVEVILF